MNLLSSNTGLPSLLLRAPALRGQIPIRGNITGGLVLLGAVKTVHILMARTMARRIVNMAAMAVADANKTVDEAAAQE